MKKFVRVWINGSVQPKLLTIDSDHGFIKRDMIRTYSVDWL
jgi:hypothetical protein